MTNTMKHLSLLGRMETDGLMLSLTGLFSENELDGACEKVERLELQARLKKNRSSQIQRKLVECGEFADLYHALCTCEIEDDRIEPMLKSADDCHESLTQYPTEQVLEAASLNVPTALTFEYLKYYLPYVKYEEEEKAILDNLWLFPVADWKGLSSLTAHQRDMMRFPFLGACLFNWHSNEKETLVLLEQNTPLQKILGLLYQQGVTVFLDSGRLKALQWLRETDIGKFRQLLEVFEHDVDDLNIFFQRWFENRAGQYDLNWFIRQEAPLNKEQREEILCNQVSYLNALYAGCLHLDFGAIRSYQFPILVYAVEHQKKHFLQLVDQNSEIFLSLSRYALLFEDCFCEHCNINSLSEKNLQDCDAAKRPDSYFDCLEEGQQYTFEEMRLLWQQDQIYVRLYAKLTPLPVDQRMIKVRCDKELLYIRTISWEKKSPHRFAILRSELQKLEQEPNKRVLTSDCGSFASLRLTKGPDGTQILEIRFTWLQEDGNDRVHGWKEDVRLPYEPFRAFAGAGEDMDGAEWRQLSIPELVTRRYEFRCRKNLQEVTGCRLLRHKLGKILEQHFQWRGTEKIVLYDDSQPYSFFFEEYTPYGRGICGAVILHGADNLQKAQYSVHT